MRRKIKLLALAFPLTLISCGKAEPKQYECFIVSVHDGDTFKDEKGNVYRLFGVDTPELNDQFNGFQPTTGIEHVCAQMAQIYASNQIYKKYVNISVVTKDKYQRVVASVIYNGKDLATELVRNGLARVAYISSDRKSPYFSDRFNYYKQLLLVQKYAFEHKVGIWANESRFSEIFPKS